MQQVSVLETNIGSSTTGNSENTQVIFNDNGTLRGDSDLTFNTALNRLTATNLESTVALTVGTSATITGDLTVNTNVLKVDSTNDRVGIRTASPAEPLTVDNSSGVTTGAIRIYATDQAHSRLSIQNGNGQAYHLVAGNPGASNAGFALYDNTGAATRWYVDNTGVHSWQNVGGVANTAMTLNSTGLGVGTSNFAYKINAAGFIAAVDPSFTGTGGSLIGAMLNNDNAAPGLDLRRWTGTAGNHGTTYISTDASGATFFYNGQQASNTKATSLKMMLDSSGNVGVGVTPSLWAATFKAIDIGSGCVVSQPANQTVGIFANAFGNGTNYTRKATGLAAGYDIFNGAHYWLNAPTGNAGTTFAFGNAAMTLDASGNLGVGTNNPAAVFGTVRSGFVATGTSGAIGAKVDATGRSCLIAWNADTAGDNNFIQFFTEATLTSRGSITYNRGSGQVAYNITSDYRLKEDIKPLTGAINRIASLKPSTYKLKETGFVCEGFIAHELAEVVPMAVTGAKDAVDSDGKPLYQAVDISKIVPILVAAIQELTAEVNALKKA